MIGSHTAPRLASTQQLMQCASWGEAILGMVWCQEAAAEVRLLFWIIPVARPTTMNMVCTLRAPGWGEQIKADEVAVHSATCMHTCSRSMTLAMVWAA